MAAPGEVRKFLWIVGPAQPFILFGLIIAAAAGLALGVAGGTDTASGGISTASAEIPAELRPAFQVAADKHGMSVNFLASIFWKEHGEHWQLQGPWATSPKGANGPFQFILSTWEGHKEDCSGDGKTDVQDLQDAACGAADLLAAIGARGITDASEASLAKLRDAASKYNSGQPWSVGKDIPETADYVPAVIKEYQTLLGTTT